MELNFHDCICFWGKEIQCNQLGQESILYFELFSATMPELPHPYYTYKKVLAETKCSRSTSMSLYILKTLSWPSFSSDFIRHKIYACFISMRHIFLCSLRCLQEKPVQELIKAQETIEVRWLFFTYSFLHRQMKVTEPTIECQRSELRRQKWCILLTMSKYLNSPERPCDNDNLVHPNDRRGPESPTVGAKRS